MIIYVFRFLTFWLFDDPELLVSNFPIVTIPFIFTFLVFFSVLKGKNAAISYFIRKLSGLNYKFWNFSPLKWASLVLWSSGPLVAGEVGISVVTREIFMCGLWLDLSSALAFSLLKKGWVYWHENPCAFINRRFLQISCDNLDSFSYMST